MPEGSSGRAGRDDREVDVGLEDLVDVVGPGVQRDVQDDLDDLRVGVAGELQGREIALRDMAALAGDLGGEAHGGVGLGVRRGAGCGSRRSRRRRDARRSCRDRCAPTGSSCSR